MSVPGLGTFSHHSYSLCPFTPSRSIAGLAQHVPSQCRGFCRLVRGPGGGQCGGLPGSIVRRQRLRARPGGMGQAQELLCAVSRGTTSRSEQRNHYPPSARRQQADRAGRHETPSGVPGIHTLSDPRFKCCRESTPCEGRHSPPPRAAEQLQSRRRGSTLALTLAQPAACTVAVSAALPLPLLRWNRHIGR